ncbi:MAG: hypothetical protein IKK75_09610 [Clostridia bacterium]|nr:hypothetical protein [Clostridia bacterium]
MECMLQAWGLEDAVVCLEKIAGEPFLCFETEKMTPEAWRDISRHSSICLAAHVAENGALLPVERNVCGALPDDLPHVLKYKGKTNADFTYLMLHCAKAASVFAQTDTPLRVLDPMCGKATTLFCAVCEGNHAVGIEPYHKSIDEADAYFVRSLKLHRIKHRRTVRSLTRNGAFSTQSVYYEAAKDAQAMKQGDIITLEMLNGDAANAAEMLKPASCHLIISDLPYGVQHAPKENGGMSALSRLLQRVTPACVKVLKPGGAIAFSYNLNTLRRREVEQALADAGMEVLTEGPYADFSHWVEQAVDRDVVVARKPIKK